MLLKRLDDYINLIDHTLLRYFEHNIPVESFDLKIIIKDQESASLIEKMIEQWIRGLVPKRCFNELCITYTDESWRIIKFTLPDEIFLGVNLTTVSVTVELGFCNAVEMCRNPVIKCVSLRVLELLHVNTSEEVLNKLLSTCTLLEKINIYLNNKLKTVMVKNLDFLRDLSIRTCDKSVILEVDDVPRLCVFTYSTFERWLNPFTIQLDAIRRRHRNAARWSDHVRCMFRHDQLKFSLLRKFSLRTWFLGKERWDITCVSLKRLTLILWQYPEIHLQIFAPKLLCFRYKGYIIPKLSFPTIVPKHVNLILTLDSPTDQFFFLKMREALSLSSNFNIDISYWRSDIVVPLNIDIDNLRRKVPYLATNVRQLLVEIDFEECMGEYLQFMTHFFRFAIPVM